MLKDNLLGGNHKISLHLVQIITFCNGAMLLGRVALVSKKNKLFYNHENRTSTHWYLNNFIFKTNDAKIAIYKIDDSDHKNIILITFI